MHTSDTLNCAASSFFVHSGLAIIASMRAQYHQIIFCGCHFIMVHSMLRTAPNGMDCCPQWVETSLASHRTSACSPIGTSQKPDRQDRPRRHCSVRAPENNSRRGPPLVPRAPTTTPPHAAPLSPAQL